MDESKFMTTTEAAKYLGMSESYVSRMRHENRGPTYIKKGRYIYYTKEFLDGFLEKLIKVVVPSNKTE